MGFLIFILVLIILVYVVPRLLVRLLPYLIKRRMRKAFGDAFDRASKTSGGQRDKRDNNEFTPPRKKIGAEIGEYVRFEEVKVHTETTVSETDQVKEVNTKITTEEQIVDVEWEDI